MIMDILLKIFGLIIIFAIIICSPYIVNYIKHKPNYPCYECNNTNCDYYCTLNRTCKNRKGRK